MEVEDEMVKQPKVFRDLKMMMSIERKAKSMKLKPKRPKGYKGLW